MQIRFILAKSSPNINKIDGSNVVYFKNDNIFCCFGYLKKFQIIALAAILDGGLIWSGVVRED
jgi:hypothetical protein